MRLTTLSLQLPLHPGDLPGFRACIAELVGFEHELFHNHDNSAAEDSDFLRWDYPVVQYAVRRGFATVIGMDAGAQAIEKVLMPALPDELSFGGRSFKIGGYRLQTQQVSCQWLEEPSCFGVAGWVGLNADNYQTWKSNPDPDARKQVLSKALTGHLRAMGKGLGLPDFSRAIAEVLRVDNQKRISWHGVQLLRFDIQVSANLSVPPGIGLGRAVAFGFGEVMSLPYYKQYRMRAKAQPLTDQEGRNPF